MKLQPDKSSAPLVRAYSIDWLQIDELRYESSVLVSSVAGFGTRAWPARTLDDVDPGHLLDMANIGAELVILGTGSKLHFPPSSWLEPFARLRIGLESMDTAAACRTYNILASEGRKVLAALLLEIPESTA